MNWKFPLAIVVMTIGWIVVERFLLGCEKSSLNRILKFTPSARKDLLYGALTVFITYCVGSKVGSWFHIPAGHWNIVIQFLTLWLLDTFLGYWHHRIMHLWFWDIHKIHHSATEMNAITNFRTHPLDFLINIPFLAFINSFAGMNGYVTAAYGLFSLLLTISVHSNIQWGNGWTGRWLLINPSRHRLHHSVEKRHHEKNFGALMIWDRIFGTYQEPDGEHEIGVK